MLGITIIKKSELNAKNEHIEYLTEKVETLKKRVNELTPKRAKDGKFISKK